MLEFSLPASRFIRRRWQFISAVHCLFMLAGLCCGFFLPRDYLVETSVQIVPEGIPDFLAESNPLIVSQSITRYEFLERAIRENDLFSYPEYETVSVAEKVALMRENLSVHIESREKITVTLLLKGRPPVKIAKAVMSLADYFIEEKIRIISEKLEGVSRLLSEKLEAGTDELDMIENTLRDYRLNHAGLLPEDLKSNMNMLEKLRNQWISGQRNLRSRKDRQIQLEREIAMLRGDMERYVPQPQLSPEEKTVPQRSEEEDRLEQLKAEFEKLSSRYTPRHPDVIRIKRTIAEIESAFLQKVQKNQSVDEKNPNRAQEDYQKKNALLRSLSAESESLKKRMGKEEKILSDLRRQIAFYEKRIEEVPKKEQDIKALLMACQSIREGIEPLSEKKKEADREIEKWNELSREKFHKPNSAKLIRHPVSPDLRDLFMLSLEIALSLSLGLSILLELFMRYDIQPNRPRSRIRQTANILLLITGVFLITGFAFLALKGAGYADSLSRIFWTEIIGRVRK